jgi:hypothetical protein
MWKKYIAGVMIIASLSGCSTIGKTTLLGAGIGGAAGAGLGLAAQQSAGSALIGGAIGSVVGAGISFLIHKDKEKRDRLLLATPLKKDTDDKTPLLTRPEVRRIWVDEKIDDNGRVYEEGHFKYIIDRNSVWSK